jgi:RNA polymerase sigma factor (sigma-70 family)
MTTVHHRNATVNGQRLFYLEAGPGPRTEAAVRAALTLDAIRWQYLHGVPDEGVVSPDTWRHDFAQVSRPGNADGALPVTEGDRMQAVLRAPASARAAVGCLRPGDIHMTAEDHDELLEQDNMPGDQLAVVPSGPAAAAFRTLYAEHGPALLRLATMLTSGDRGRAEDLVQETMLRAWIHRANLDIQRRSPRPWLITVARHLAVDARRARQARPHEAELDDNLALADGQQADAIIDEADVRPAVAALPAAQRQVLPAAA